MRNLQDGEASVPIPTVVRSTLFRSLRLPLKMIGK